MFVSDSECRDIQTLSEFITTSAKKPDGYDGVKLKNVLKYIKLMRKMKLTLSVGDMSVVKWWVDASYAVLINCR